MISLSGSTDGLLRFWENEEGSGNALLASVMRSFISWWLNFGFLFPSKKIKNFIEEKETTLKMRG